MGEFFSTISGFPTVFFTVGVVTSVCYWAISTVLGIGDSVFESDLELDTETSDAFNLLSVLGLSSAPLSIVLTAFSLVGWLMSIILVTVLGGGVIVATIVFFGACIAGVFAAGRLAKLVEPVFTMTRASRHEHLVGRICTIQTGKANPNFGQAEVVGPNGGSHLIQVRTLRETLEKGDKALLVQVDGDGVFTISSDVGVIQ